MIKKCFVLLCCLVLPAAFSYAHGTTRTEKEKGRTIPIELIEAASASSLGKSSSIIVTLDGHVLSVVFTENLGQVAIDISTAAGTSVDYSSLNTPNGENFYIPNTGSYVVTFTLPNGDVYYGEFEVTD